MITRFDAHSAIKPGQVDVAWSWQSNALLRPGLRLVRQQRCFARSVAQGLTVVDLADGFSTERQPWARIARSIYALPNAQAEGGLRQAVVALYYGGAADVQPGRVTITNYAATTDQMTLVVINDVTRIEMTDTAADPWANVHTMDIFAAPGGGPEAAAGQVRIATGHAIENTRNQFQWTAPAQPSVTLLFESIVPEITIVGPDTLVDEAERFEVQLLTTQTQNGLDVPINRLTVSDTFNPDTGDWQRTAELDDMGLTPETVYYYSLFAPGADGTYQSNREWRADAIPTRAVGFDRRLYNFLPPVLQQMDEATVAQQGQGDLRRFVSLFGVAADQMRSLLDQARGRHDLHNTAARVLPFMARWIGWEPDLTLDELAQRRDIGMAPEVFETVGSLPNLQALVNRVTRWQCRVKEFVHNIFLTNAPETIQLWEIFERRFDGAAWTDPAPMTVIDGFDGHPAITADSGGVLWLFWHADRTQRREIWFQRHDGTDPMPRRVMEDAPDDDPENMYVDESPASLIYEDHVRLFWSSNREGSWEIWTRSFDGLPGGAPQRLTEHKADDRSPSVAVDGSNRLWVFWQSNRRGPTDIWARFFTAGEWSLARRITTATFKHEKPAVAQGADGRLWLFWVEDSGDRRNIHYCIQNGDTFSDARAATSGRHRDESPAVILFNGLVWLFFASNRNGFWQIWFQRFEGMDWSIPEAVTAETTADKEPAVVHDNEDHLRVYWRSQRRGRRYQSRTLDFNDELMLTEMKTFHDRSHYTYDTGTNNDDWYSRGAVGLYLTPETADPAVIEHEIERAKGFIEPFRALPIRLVWLTDAEETEEIIDTTDLINEEVTDTIS